MTIIYALINPITECPFYVGSTRRTLKERLYEHIRENKEILFKNKSIRRLKQNIIIELLDKGIEPSIKRLIIVNDEYAHVFEYLVYKHYKSIGFVLLQSEKDFCKTIPGKRDFKKIH